MPCARSLLAVRQSWRQEDSNHLALGREPSFSIHGHGSEASAQLAWTIEDLFGSAARHTGIDLEMSFVTRALGQFPLVVLVLNLTTLRFRSRLCVMFAQAVVGLFALGAGIFGVTALGMGIMAGIVAVGVAKGELDPSPQVRCSRRATRHYLTVLPSLVVAVWGVLLGWMGAACRDLR